MTVVALSGRRIDAADASVSRFPLQRVPAVGALLRDLFSDRRASALVASAACGADLVALQVAGSLGLRRRVILPFHPERFRETSVTDRPGDWGPSYDEVIGEVRAAGDLVVLEQDEGGGAYAAALEAILDEALEMATREGSDADAKSEGNETSGVLAVVVWDGAPRGDDDYTQRFADMARARGVPVTEIITIVADQSA